MNGCGCKCFGDSSCDHSCALYWSTCKGTNPCMLALSRYKDLIYPDMMHNVDAVMARMPALWCGITPPPKRREHYTDVLPPLKNNFCFRRGTPVRHSFLTG